jgi:GNAT superfamily N-acetyltransferase
LAGPARASRTGGGEDPPAAAGADRLLAAMDDNLWSFWRDYGLGPGAELHEAEALGWLTCRVPLGMFNAVPRVRLEPAAFDAAFARIADSVARRGVAATWWAGPASRPTDLATRLEAAGLTLARTMTGMLRGLDGLEEVFAPPPGLRIERVEGVAMRRVFGRVVAEGIGLSPAAAEALEAYEPQLTHAGYLAKPRYLGWLDGRPVASAALVPAAGLAGVYAVATIPSARGRGIGAAMTVLPLLEARQAGYGMGVLQATAMGHPLYRRLGFRDVGAYRCYAMVPPRG